MRLVIESNSNTCKALTDKELKEIYDKMCFIEDNKEQFAKLLLEQYPLDKLSKEFEGNPSFLRRCMDEVILDLDTAYDEFCIRVLAECDDIIPIEVVTKDVAESNDRDFVNEDEGYSKEELDSYVVGGTLSIYTRITDKNREYYFRFL